MIHIKWMWLSVNNEAAFNWLQNIHKENCSLYSMVSGKGEGAAIHKNSKFKEGNTE